MRPPSIPAPRLHCVGTPILIVSLKREAGAGTRPRADEVDSGLWVTPTHCPRGGLCPPHRVTRRRTWRAHGIISRPGGQREPSAQGQHPHPGSGWPGWRPGPRSREGALQARRPSCYEISSLSALPVPGKREQVLERPRLRVICAHRGIPAPGPPVTGPAGCVGVCGSPLRSAGVSPDTT